MEILNVIEIDSETGAVDVWSYVVSGKQPRTADDKMTIDKAESHLLQIVERRIGEELSFDDKDDVLDNGYFNGETFDAYLNWSIVVGGNK